MPFRAPIFCSPFVKRAIPCLVLENHFSISPIHLVVTSMVISPSPSILHISSRFCIFTIGPPQPGGGEKFRTPFPFPRPSLRVFLSLPPSLFLCHVGFLSPGIVPLCALSHTVALHAFCVCSLGSHMMIALFFLRISSFYFPLLLILHQSALCSLSYAHRSLGYRRVVLVFVLLPFPFEPHVGSSLFVGPPLFLAAFVSASGVCFCLGSTRWPLSLGSFEILYLPPLSTTLCIFSRVWL